jgi:PAS domain S-box-containing protein
MSAESTFASLAGLAQTITDSPIPMGAIDLSDRRVLVANEALAELFGRSSADMLGRPASVLWERPNVAHSKDMLEALARGAIDSYRARRTIGAASGSVDVWLWVRRVNMAEGSVAVAVVVPVTDPSVAGRLIGNYLGPDAIDLAVGTIDAEGRLSAITENSDAVIGLRPEEIEGSDLVSFVHPDDVDRLERELAHAVDSSEETTVTVRLRHPELEWAEVRCLALPGRSGAPLRLAFALAEPVVDQNSTPEAERFAHLERQVLRIAAELHALNLSSHSPLEAHEARLPALDALSPRQREVVDRLLRGERMPAIAAAMYLSQSTVRNHLSSVFKHFGVGSQAELLATLRSALPCDEGTGGRG